MEKKEKNKDIEEIYKELDKISKICEVYKTIEEKNLWDKKIGRWDLPYFLGEDPDRYATTPTHGFIAAMTEIVEEKIIKANQELYNNLFNLLEKYEPEEIGMLIASIPFYFQGEIKDKDIEKIAMHHKAITNIKEMDVGVYRKLLESEKTYGKRYAKLTLDNEALKKEMEYNIIEYINYLIGDLKRIKKERLIKS